MRILIIKPSSLGDVIHSMPVVTALEAHGYTVDFCVRSEYRDIVEMNTNVAEILMFPSKVSDIEACLNQFKGRVYDAVIDLQCLLRSALLTWWIKTPRRIGLPDARECSYFFYTETVTYSPDTRHAISRYLSVLTALDVPWPYNLDYGLKVPELIRHPDLEDISEYVVVSPFTRQLRKTWPVENTLKLIKSLSKIGRHVLVIGKDLEGLLSGMLEKPEGPGRVVDLINKTDLKQLAAVIKNSSMFITVDSGPMHLAAALNIPVVALFGPTDPAKIGPFTEKKVILGGNGMELKNISCQEVVSAYESLV